MHTGAGSSDVNGMNRMNLPRWRRRLPFLALIMLAAFLLLLLLAVLGVAGYRQASLPQREGRIHLSGLQTAVDVLREANGVPHVFAQSEADAWFALGFLHAQDRMWQLEMNRRVASGRVAEVLGPDALGTDRFLRTLGVHRNAQAIYPKLDPSAQLALRAYASGINAWLDSGATLPPEFHLTGAPRPRPWEPADSLAWQTMMAWDLGANWTQEALRMKLAQRFSLERINSFLAPYPGDAPVPTRDYVPWLRSLQSVSGALDRTLAQAPPSGIEGLGSNNWVVDGRHTRSGKPLLANDPHLNLSAPAVWYVAHLSAPGLEVVGATLPGLPGVVLGRNDRIAWGFTNTAPDVQDLYVEQLDPANPRRYRTPDGWAEFEVRTESIKVKGRPDERLDVRVGRHGPIVTGLLPTLDRAGLDERFAVAFAWTALRDDDLTLQAGLAVNRARDWPTFLAALRDFHSPQQNVVYADVDGNVGFVAPGRVPVRKPENDLKGLVPAPGWHARYDWAGFIPFDALPRRFNPPEGIIVTANEKIVGADYPHFITSEWSLPYRAQRIEQLLKATPRHDLASFARIQSDVTSLAARQLLPLMLEQVQPASARARRAVQMLTGWQGEMLAERPEPLLYQAWTRELARQTFSDELGPELMRDHFEQRNVYLTMVKALQGDPAAALWCRDVRPNAAPTDCRALLTTSLEAALSEWSAKLGDDLTAWRWGEVHAAHSEHRPMARVKALSWLFDVRRPSPGDTYTVNVGRFNLRDEQAPFRNRHAASLRALHDLAQPEGSRFVHSTGQSGHPLSPHYRDWARPWVEGRSFAVPTRRETLQRAGAARLELLPR